jgi:hypothetical protein
MRAKPLFALSSFPLLLCAALALSQKFPDTKTAQATQANQSGLLVEIPLATASRLERAKDSWWHQESRFPRRFCRQPGLRRSPL